MRKSSKKLLIILLAMIVVVAFLSIRYAVGRHRTIHADPRTLSMLSLEDTMPDRALTMQELLQEPARQQTVTLHRAVYYPEAETLICFVEGLGHFYDYHFEPLADAPSMVLARSYGISTMIFENIPPDAVAGPLIIELTDPQVASSVPVSFPLG